jgi:GNAT superfamily N-acetyltransferase
MSIVYTTYDESLHLDQLAALEQYLWKGKSNEQLKEIFRWKYPSDAHLKNGFVAMDGDRLVAFAGFFINDYTDGNIVFPVAITADSVTHPDYRGYGLFSRLTLMGTEYYDTNGMGCILCMTSNIKSSAARFKLGFQPLTRKIIGLRPVLKGILPRYNASSRLFLRQMIHQRIEVIHTDTISPELAAELAVHFETTRGGQFSLLRNAKFWLHRYNIPYLTFKYIILRNDGKVVGFVSYMESFSRRYKVKHVKIVDISPVSKFTDILIKAVGIYTGYWLISVYLTSPDALLYKELNRLFPLKYTSKKNDLGDHIMIKPLSASANLPDMCNSKNWAFGYIDLDSI